MWDAGAIRPRCWPRCMWDRPLRGDEMWAANVRSGSTRAGCDLRERSVSPPRLRESAYWCCRELAVPAISSHTIDQEIGTRMTGFKYSRHRPTPTRVRTLSKAVTRGHVVLIDV